MKLKIYAWWSFLTWKFKQMFKKNEKTRFIYEYDD